MAVTLKENYVIDDITSLSNQYWVENFKPCNKHICVLAKKIGLVIRNISAEIFGSRLEEIWKNRELVKLEKLVSEKEDWFTETL